MHHDHAPQCKHIPFVSTVCSDTRLHHLVSRLDRNEFHRDRRFAGALDFVIDQSALLKHAAVTTSFTSVTFDSIILLSHTDCAAVRGNNYYTTLQEKRRRFTDDSAGDIEFNRVMLGKLKRQTENLPFEIRWHFGIILTEKVVRLPESVPLEVILNDAILWPFEKPPIDIFGQHAWDDVRLRVA